tara:strand:+ start:3037 stop:3249 length:213 start_codon:yes stop_codon:yes gene_type:complete
MKILITEEQKKRLIKEQWQDESKWSKLEADVQRAVEWLIKNHKDNFNGSQYDVIAAVEDIMEGMFARVRR